ncbi:DUF3888 domain-containing protein [Niameybacter massiliensis]|uniref:DUF3888 domain-containing protein n=1 Tax=Holtiella tumoricola TaxID=3018743 RepID=A0AA42DQ07_9FIRM|nr:DUF3888 domain-containing protein [Holtiella tumoricola]MDA3733043.1 DUF3888 domain-containing protein [Holtiella tumoricola]
MKKLNVLLFILLLCCSTFVFASSAPADTKAGIPYPYTPAEGSIEELYKDMLVTTLDPVISAEIEKQYGMPLLYGLYDVDFLHIDREAYRGFSFILKVRVKPFVGPHNTIGIDEITLSITPAGIKVENFAHKKSFEVPDYKKDNYPNLKMPPIS